MIRRCCAGGGSILPAVLLVFLPKCPLCLAAWLTVAPGFGVSGGGGVLGEGRAGGVLGWGGGGAGSERRTRASAAGLWACPTSANLRFASYPASADCESCNTLAKFTDETAQLIPNAPETARAVLLRSR